MIASFLHADGLAVKICGITSREQAEAVISAGADALGINFWERSSRFVPLAAVRDWLPDLRAQISLVAVTVNATDELIEALIASQCFTALQLHGDEPPTAVAALVERGIEVIKALQIRDRESLDAIGSYPTPHILLDAFNPSRYGGAGESFPWELALEAREKFPDKRIILAGGLTPANVGQAVATVRPCAVDVASGVESAPGVKDLAKVRSFIEAARIA